MMTQQHHHHHHHHGFGQFPVTFVALIILFLAANDFGAVGGVSVEEDLTLSLNEKKALDKFKVRMTPLVPHDYMKQDIYLIRWLRAKNLDLGAAEEMLRQNLQWRIDNKIDTIGEEDLSDMKDEYEYTNDSFDKKGRPLGTINFGTWNIRKAVLAGKGRRLLRYLDKLMEEISQRVILAQKQGQLVTQYTVLLNMEGFNIPQSGCPRCLPLYISFVNSLEQHYPGQADKLILINTNPAFQIVLELVRPIFSTQTRNALRIFAGDKGSSWGPYLDKEISREERRPEYGGTKRD